MFKRFVLLLAVAAMLVVMLVVTAGPALAAPGNNGKGATTPPIAAEPLLTLRTLPIADVGEEVLEIAETATQVVGWLLDGDDSNDTDESGNDADTSESSAQIE